MPPRILTAAASLVTLVAALAPQLMAQDVTVTPLVWADPAGAPDELPVLKRPIRVEFPDETRSTPEIGYVVYHLYLDGKGQILGLGPHATLALYERVGRPQKMNEWAWKPGRREGKGVNTETTFALVFNPASAAEKLRNATPRLLEVSVVPHPRPNTAKSEDAFPDQVVYADVSINEDGLVTEVSDAPPAFADEFKIAVKNWRFAPARKEGNPVAAKLRVPFIVVTGAPDDSKSHRVPPRVIARSNIVYPYAMQASGMKGEVLVDFDVDIEGRVRNAFVVRSLNPSFDDSALDAVRQWRFEPGTMNGRPVHTRMQVPIVFSLENPIGSGMDFGGGEGPLETRQKANLAKLPEEFRYDTPPHPIGTVRPVYPYGLLREGKEGRAVVRFMIGPSGRVEFAQVNEATAPEFGAALLAAIECFVYEPALKAGRPSSALVGFEEEFNRDENRQLVGADDLDLLRREKKKPRSIVSLRDVDAPLTPISRRPPRFPLSVKPDVTAGRAMIEFLVDEEGRARLPRMVEATDDAFGYAAIQGIATWRFQPPTRGGRAVVVRVRQPMEFSRTVAPAEEKK